MSIVLMICLFLPPLFVALIIYILCKAIYLFLKEMIKRAKTDNGKTIFNITFILSLLICVYKFFEILIKQNYYRSSAFVYILCIILTIIFIKITNNKKKKTVKGVNEYNKWKAFKNFLNDFGSFKDKGVLDIKLWEHYLVYATLFGCSKKYLKLLK